MTGKVRRAGTGAGGAVSVAGSQSPGRDAPLPASRGEAAEETGNEAVRGELDRVAARTGLPAVDVRRCLFHSDAYRAKVAAATATDEEALIDEMMPGRRAIEDVFDETFALSQAIEERLDEIKAAAAAGTLLRPEDKAVDETKDTSAFAQADENPMDGELEYVTGKTGMPLAAVRRCLVESALCRIDHNLAEAERNVALMRH